MSKEFVQQYEWDCLLCCLAIATGGDYDKLWRERIPPNPADHLGGWFFVDRMISRRGIFGEDVDRAFAHAGLALGIDYQIVRVPLAAIDCTKQMLRWRRAILQVPSLNQEGGTHIVYWDGEQVHDPSPKQKYKWLQGMVLQNIWLLKD